MSLLSTGNDILLESDIIFDSDEKNGCSMLYLILTLMLGMGHKKPWVLLLLKATKGGWGGG